MVYNVVFAYNKTQQKLYFHNVWFFHNVREFHYNLHQGTTYGKKEYDKRQRYTQPTPFGYHLDTNFLVGYMQKITLF